MWRDILNKVGGYAALPFLIGGLTVNEITRRLVRSSLRPFKNYKIVSGAREGYFHCLAKRGGGNALVLGISGADCCDINVEKDHFLSKILKDPSFENLKYWLRVKRGYLCYEKVSEFEISNHVKMWHGSQDRVITQKELVEKILPALSKPISPEKAPWEWIILPRVQLSDNPIPETIRIFRMHQSYTNGFGAHEVFYQMMDWETEDGKPPYIFDPWRPMGYKDWIAEASFRLPPRVVSDYIFRDHAENKPLLTNHGFYLSSSFPLSVLKLARKANPTHNIDSLLLSAFKTALKKVTNQREKKTFITASVGLVPASKLSTSKLQNRCYWITRNWNLSNNFLRVQRSPDDIATWLRDMLIERLPLAVQDNLIERENLDIFATLVNIPLTKKRGSINGKEVRKITSFTPEPNPIGIGLILTTYGNDCIVSCTVDKNIIPPESMECFLNSFIAELDGFAK